MEAWSPGKSKDLPEVSVNSLTVLGSSRHLKFVTHVDNVWWLHTDFNLHLQYTGVKGTTHSHHVKIRSVPPALLNAVLPAQFPVSNMRLSWCMVTVSQGDSEVWQSSLLSDARARIAVVCRTRYLPGTSREPFKRLISKLKNTLGMGNEII